ncbi:hypothetical protein BH20ACT5_BH20ACT5_23320 [soil metagenome]
MTEKPAQTPEEHAAEMAAAKEALDRLAAEKEARAKALQHVRGGSGRGGSKVGPGQQNQTGARMTGRKSGDR